MQANQHLCFRYIDSTIHLFLELKFRACSNFLWPCSPACVGWVGNPKTGFLMTYPISASMVGIAIGMLVVGAILGLLVAYGIYKKIDTSIPYQVTD